MYEYRCTQCGYHYEKIQSFKAEPETECPKCHGALMRPLTAPALQFKGAGWYVNDYAPKVAGGSTDTKAGDSNAGTATESKPAASESSAKQTTSESTSTSGSSESASKSTTPPPASS